jgi:hypothetical protein
MFRSPRNHHAIHTEHLKHIKSSYFFNSLYGDLANFL